MKNVREYFGNIDIYLFDQIQKGRFDEKMSILDAGCGGGRNLIYFLRTGHGVFAVDENAGAVEQVRQIASTLAPDLSSANFQVSAVGKLPFADEKFDAVLSSAVLHFAAHPSQFDAMLHEMWRVLKPGGLFFARLASSIGIENLIRPTKSGRYQLPDGSERFLVDQQKLLSLTKDLGANLLEPIKTTNVQNLRSMTTWVLSKGA